MHIGTSRSNFNCLYTPLTTIHLPSGLTLTSPASEKGPLLTSRGEMGYYKLHTQGPLHSSGKGSHLISALTFVPQISLHKGAVFKCQVSYVGKDKIVEERVSERFTILCKKSKYINIFHFCYNLNVTINCIYKQLLQRFLRYSWQTQKITQVNMKDINLNVKISVSVLACKSIHTLCISSDIFNATNTIFKIFNSDFTQ